MIVSRYRQARAMRVVSTGAALALASMLSVLVGCGGGGGRSGEGSRFGTLSVQVKWPAPAQQGTAGTSAIPAGTRCIRVRLTNGGGWEATAAVARPETETASTVTLSQVPTGQVHIHFGAYSDFSTGGNGAVTAAGDLLAWAAKDVDIPADVTITVGATLSDEPSRVEISTGGASTSLLIGETLQLTATAYDADGNVLLTAIRWLSSAPGVAEVTGNGLVTAKTGGQADIQATAGPASDAVTVEVAANTPPEAAFTVTPEEGTTATMFAFDASTTTDLETSPGDLEVRWDWETDGAWDTGWSTTKAATHSYGSAGTKTVTLEVRDGGGLTATATRTAVVSGGAAGPGKIAAGTRSDIAILDPDTGAVTTLSAAPWWCLGWWPDSMHVLCIPPDNYFSKLAMDNTTTRLFQHTIGSPWGADISPDGTKIACHWAGPSGSTRGVWVANLDGSNARLVRAGAVAPRWSPDGARIAYNLDPTQEIRVINADGTDDHDVTSAVRGGWYSQAPAWTPDGQRIVFMARDTQVGHTNDAEIFVIDANARSSSAATQITFLGGHNRFPTVSPEGTRAAFGHGDGSWSTVNQVRVVNLDGSNVRTIYTKGSGETIGYLAWSRVSE